MNQLWLALLSSSLVSAVVGAFVAGWFSLRSKRSEYVNEYYKLVLKRRIDAYEQVEQIVIMLKATVVGPDGQPYHLLFAQEDQAAEVYKILFRAMSKALWLTDDLFDRVRELNTMFVSQGSGSSNGVIDFGQRNYRQLAELRTKIERLHARDMLALHDMRGFLKGKKPTDSYAQIASAV